MKKHYILVSVDNPESTFTMKDREGNILSCEIYSINLLESLYDPKNLGKTILPGITQADAFRQFRKYFPTLFKRTTKSYTEIELRF